MKRSILLLLSAFALAGTASAQLDFDKRVADVGLLQAKQVQNEIKITEAQRAKMNVAAETHKKSLEDYQKQMQALGTLTPDKKRLMGFFETLKVSVLATLTPAQTRRLRELTLQRLGLVTLTDPIVSQRVGLSSAQVEKLKNAFEAGKTKFQAIQQTARAAAEPIAAQFKGRNPKTAAEAASMNKEVQAKLKPIKDRYEPQLKAIGKSTDEAMLAVLTAPQKAKWTALKGVPFNVK